MCPEHDAASEETLRTEAAVRARIDLAVADADFSNSLPPDFAGVTPDVRQVLTEFSKRADTADATQHLLAGVHADQGGSAAPGGTA